MTIDKSVILSGETISLASDINWSLRYSNLSGDVIITLNLSSKRFVLGADSITWLHSGKSEVMIMKRDQCVGPLLPVNCVDT